MERRRELGKGETLGRYEILDRIGAGGFGNVYRAFDPLIQREVALKTCESADASVQERFAREARLAGGLDHPNIVRIYDFDPQEEGPSFIVQEFLEGEDLAQRLTRREAMPLAEKLRVLDAVACGLAHAHAQGVVHRDIKPANIRLLGDGRVKIMDFGIAKAAGSDPTMTRPGTTMGSLGYMSPEQVEGQDVDQRTDLFALGIVSYEVLGGRRPFQGDGVAELFQRILHDEPEPLSSFALDVPVELDALVLRCLEKEPARRPSTADEFRRELEAAWTRGARPRDARAGTVRAF
jgi:serine/threonine-protein kinase